MEVSFEGASRMTGTCRIKLSLGVGFRLIKEISLTTRRRPLAEDPFAFSTNRVCRWQP